MSPLVVVAAVAVTAFMLAYVRAGRLGFTVLALIGGYVMALFWADVLAGSTTAPLPFVAWPDAVYAGLVLMPGVLALLFTTKQKSIVPRVVGAAVVAGLAILLLLPLFGEASGHELYVVANEYRESAISVALGVGLLDMMFARPTKAPKRNKD